MYSNNIFQPFFFNVDISLIMHDPSLKLYLCIKNIVFEGTVSEISDRGPGLFHKKYFKNILKINKKLSPFQHKTKSKT